MNKTALSQSFFNTIIVSVKLNFRTLKAKIARSIEAHRTGAVEAISLRNQGIASNTIPYFHISNFMAKASCFCLFFYPYSLCRFHLAEGYQKDLFFYLIKGNL
jgi:hypothetical protein